MSPDIFGFMLLAAFLTLLFALIWAAFWAFSVAWPVVSSIAVSAGLGIRQNHYINRLLTRYPRFFAFLFRRLDRGQFAGLPLTILLGAFIYFFGLYIGSTLDFVLADPIINADFRLANLFFAYRDPILVRFFTFVTAFGASGVVIVLALGVSVILLLRRRMVFLTGLWLSLVGSAVSVPVLKNVFARPRSELGVYWEQSNSFPSGHANISIAFYGFLAYLVLRHTRRRLPVVVLAVVVAFLIGFSRLYLVEHYLSDVLNGYLIGSIWLLFSVMIVEWMQARHPRTPELVLAWGSYATGAIWSVMAVTTLFLAITYSPRLRVPPTVQISTLDGSVETAFATGQLQPFTETILGSRQEPTSLVILAKNDAALVSAFERAQWRRADRVGFSSFSEAIHAAWFNGEYTTAPVTPSFWMKRPNAFGFQKSTNTNSLRERHHARFWKSGLRTADGLMIYVGTASFDNGLKWGITHHIDPNIDKERDILVSDLVAGGVVVSQRSFQLIPAVLGENFVGDPFFTDGKAIILVLR